MAEQYVIFSQRAFNSIVTETIDKHPIETGGILIGYVLDNGAWVVIENIPPGYNAVVHDYALFEYDADFVNYLSNVVAKQYVGNLQVLGLWHRHPGSMDVFSHTDDGTNLQFASNRECGAISALVNTDPQMRITMYHVSQTGKYDKIDWFVDDGQIIPKHMTALHYTSAESLPFFNGQGIVPNPSNSDIQENQASSEMAERDGTSQELNTPESSVEGANNYSLADAFRDFKEIIKKLIG